MVDRSEIRIRAYVEELDALRIQCDQQAHATADGIPGRNSTARYQLPPRDAG